MVCLRTQDQKMERNQGYINGLLEALRELGVPEEELPELYE